MSIYVAMALVSLGEGGLRQMVRKYGARTGPDIGFTAGEEAGEAEADGRRSRQSPGIVCGAGPAASACSGG